MEMTEGRRLRHRRKLFSSLDAGRDAATRLPYFLHLDRMTFSTLHAGRDAATHKAELTWQPNYLFQYPPCGSRRCNGWLKGDFGPHTNLSVPSMRVETLQ